MEFPMRVLVVTVVMLIAIMIFLMIASGWFGRGEILTNNFFDWARGVAGITEGPQPALPGQ